MSELHVRNLPPELHERLRVRANAEGRSMSAEVVAILRRVLEQPTGTDRRTEAVARLRWIQARHQLPAGTVPAEELVRADRAATR
ncbi:MAG: FitA-like ribbon-helix-helix domain-containing protein [Pseudonocardia sp.]